MQDPSTHRKKTLDDAKIFNLSVRILMFMGIFLASWTMGNSQEAAPVQRDEVKREATL